MRTDNVTWKSFPSPYSRFPAQIRFNSYPIFIYYVYIKANTSPSANATLQSCIESLGYFEGSQNSRRRKILRRKSY